MFAARNAFLTRVVSEYFLNKSLRFRSSASAYLNRTFAAGNRTTWTWSGWVKRGTFSNSSVFGTQSAVTGVPRASMGFTSDAFDIQFNPTGSAWTVTLTTTQVFRDPAAWYHLVIAVDTTQGTTSDRIKFYVNGSQVTAFSTATYPTASINLPINLNQAHQICADGLGTSNFDGEMAEINFVDGQALTPTAFGASSIYNQWLPKKYAGTYGTNGFYLPFTNTTPTTTYAGSFNGSTQYLNVDSIGAIGTSDFTVESWIYTTTLAGERGPFQISDTAGGIKPSYASGIAASLGGVGSLGFITCNVLGTSISSSSAVIAINTWYHFAITRQSGSVRMFVNGVLVGGPTTVSGSIAAQNIVMGCYYSLSYLWNGYLSNFRLVNGTAVYTAAFTPPVAPFTAITNTSLLTLQNATIIDNSTNAFTITNTGTVATSVQTPWTALATLVADSSGNANNWTPNNISLTAGSTYDSLTDVPTLTSATVANYCVINPLSSTLNSGTISNGNLKNAGAFGGSACIAFGTIGVTSGKFYFEVESVSNGGHGQAGLGINTNNNTLVKWSGDGGDTGYTTYGTYGVAFDVEAGKLWYRNTSGSWVSGDPATGASPTSTFTANMITFPYCTTSRTSGFNEAGIGNWNFGQQPFVYTAPTGFLPINTYNLVPPTFITLTDFLVVAGGGGGGTSTNGGGGGAGGYRTDSLAQVIKGQTYTVTVGAGGNAATSGTASTFSAITSAGGGFGGGTPAGTGGSGGGGGGGNSPGANGNTPATVPSQGNGGGNAGGANGFTGGGGGGSGGYGFNAGGNFSSASGGGGGFSTTNAISGTVTDYAGGGGGASLMGSAASGGGGGGGMGAVNNNVGGSGTANTGGGGGAGGSGGGSGGSGVVIIRYADTYTAASATTGSPTITVAGGYRVYKFTATGSITF
jgi:hypothetical protein